MIYWTHFKKCLQYNEHNIPVWLYKMLVYLSLNISCFFEGHICSQLVPGSPFFFGTDNVINLEIVIDSPSMGGVFTTRCQKWDSNWQLIKLQLTCEDHAFLWFYIGSSKVIIFFLIHSLNLRKKENRCFDNILFVNDSSVITKYPFLTLSCVLKVGRARWECLFCAFIVWRKARL